MAAVGFPLTNLSVILVEKRENLCQEIGGSTLRATHYLPIQKEALLWVSRPKEERLARPQKQPISIQQRKAVVLPESFPGSNTQCAKPVGLSASS